MNSINNCRYYTSINQIQTRNKKEIAQKVNAQIAKKNNGTIVKVLKKEIVISNKI